MAHTDRHRPYWVQLADPEERNFYHYQRWSTQAKTKVLIHQTCSCRWHNMYWPRHIETWTRRRREHEAAIRVIRYGDIDAFDTL